MPPRIVAIEASNAPEDIQRLQGAGIPLVSEAPVEAWQLINKSGALTLLTPDGLSQNVDFIGGKSRHRSKEPGLGAAPLKKALGLTLFQKRWNRLPHIIDATGGWGQDAWIMASMGCKITLIEQHPVVHALLASGLTAAQTDSNTHEIAQRVELLHDNAIDRLDKISADIIYLDPMYPHRARKKADSKKGMQILQALLGPADDKLSEQLLAAALGGGTSRVVVKRPKGSEQLPAPAGFGGQTINIQSPNTRYDIYLTHSRSA